MSAFLGTTQILNNIQSRIVTLLTPLVAAVVLSNAAGAQELTFDQSTLKMERPAMATLLEKTIFKVNVAWLELWFTPDLCYRLQALAADPRPASRDSIAAIATRATDVFARLHFERDVSLDQFLDGLQGSARRARDAGIISPATYDDIVESSPGWYAFLEERGIRSGDEMFYRIRGDTLRTAYRTASGEILLDQRDIGPERRLSVLGGYLAAGSDFRRGLIDSVGHVASVRAGHGRPDRP